MKTINLKLQIIFGALILCFTQAIGQPIVPDRRFPQRFFSNDLPKITQVKRDIINNTIEVKWKHNSSVSTKNTEYQLEWTFVDGTGKLFFDTRQKRVPYRFRHNCTRISTSNKYYKIADVFENGFVIFRIRTKGGLINQTSKWSLPESGLIKQRSSKAFTRVGRCEEDMNWQLISSYAEEGKRKDVIKYLDGSGRSRQTQTVVNSNRNVLVAETIYDTAGRPAIISLPAPAFSHDTFFKDDLRFKQSFSISGPEPYAFKDFKVEGQRPNMMGTMSGASRYFSTNNPSKTGMEAQVPDAEGFPFSETEYTKDLTGRISRVGSVGPSLQIGSGHETQFFYDKPTQIELDRLFGNDAGYAEHYQRQFTIDPNGQIHVAVYNLTGKVVYSGLKGKSPDNLDTLDHSHVVWIDTLRSEMLVNRQPSDNKVVESVDFVVTEVNSNYHFSYKLDPMAFTYDGCSLVCNDCVYDLSISIKDSDGATLWNKKLTTRNVTDSCISSQVVFDTTLVLQIGTYNISRMLAVNMDSVDKYVEHQIAENSDCIFSIGFFNSESLKSEKPSCLTCESQKCFTSFDSVSYPAEAALNLLKADMSPGGQYATYDWMGEDDMDRDQWLNRATSIYYPQADYNEVSGLFPPHRHPDEDQIVDWSNVFRHPLDWSKESGKIFGEGEFRRADGKIDSVLVNGHQGQYNIDYLIIKGLDSFVLAKHITDRTFFIQSWKQSYAVALVPYHPEFCYYRHFIEMGETLDELKIFENKINNVATWKDAKENGFLEQIMTDHFALDLSSLDVSLAIKKALQDSIQDYTRISNAERSLYQIIYGAVVCSNRYIDRGNIQTCLLGANQAGLPELYDEANDKMWAMMKGMYQGIVSNYIKTLQEEYILDHECRSNVCIGNEANNYLNTIGQLEYIFNYDQTWNQVQNPICGTFGYENKTKRFAYNNNLNEINPQALQNLLMAKYYAECGKCPLVVELEMLFNQLSFAKSVSDEAKPIVGMSRMIIEALGIDECNLANQTEGFTYKIEYGNSVQIIIMYCNQKVCKIGLKSPGNAKVPWNKIVNFSCLEYFPGSTTKTFRVMATTGDGDRFILVGESCLELETCNIPQACTLTKEAIELVKIVDYTLKQFSPAPIKVFDSNTYDISYPIDTRSKLLEHHQYIDSITSEWTKESGLRIKLYDDQKAEECSISFKSLGKNSFIKSDLFPGIKVYKAIPYCPDGKACEPGMMIVILAYKDQRDTLLVVSDCFVLTNCQPFQPKACPNLASSNIMDDGRLDGLSTEEQEEILEQQAIIDTVDFKTYSKPKKIWSQTISSAYKDRFGISFNLRQVGILESISNQGNVVYSNRITRIEELFYLTLEKVTGNNAEKRIVQLNYDSSPSTSATISASFEVDSLSFYRITLMAARPPHINLEEWITKNIQGRPPSLSDLYKTIWKLTDIKIRKSDCNACCPILPGKFEYKFDCAAHDSIIIAENIDFRRNNYITHLRDSLRHAYISHCLSVKDNLQMTMIDRLYAVTLYYYDAAGNLIKTVPPKGVHSFSNDEANQVAVSRSNNQYYTYPSHSFVTSYQYTSLNQVAKQHSPDADTVRTWFDPLGRVWLSQTGRQRLLNEYNYLTYDRLNRIEESGAVTLSASGLQNLFNSPFTGVNNRFVLIKNESNRKEITNTIYDSFLPDISSSLSFVIDPVHLRRNGRGRISSLIYRDSSAQSLTPASLTNASYYIYDIHGFVKSLIQHNPAMGGNHRFKKIDYNYDVINGLVKNVSYQRDQFDAFYHKYVYDADNRLESVFTSLDSTSWDPDVRYEYYHYGPLAMEFYGEIDAPVQKREYTYTLHGWLKGINMQNTDDSIKTVGERIHYFEDDYKAISESSFSATLSLLNPDQNANSLYNGNISGVNNLNKALRHITPDNSVAQAYLYQYDQLHRLTRMNAGYAENSAYAMALQYDPNGNIINLDRNAILINGSFGMDSLIYTYASYNNRLDHVKDAVGAEKYDVDIDDQANGNYGYDADGNLIKDDTENIKRISWNSKGKINKIEKTADEIISFSYDAVGRRTGKQHIHNGSVNSTYYILDANGRQMAIYTQAADDSMHWESSSIYGTDRLGLFNPEGTIKPSMDTFSSTKQYELTDHLGNILAVISGDLETDTVKIHSAQDYYPFGMQMVDRNITNQSYRYGYNGMEKDDEAKGEGNEYTTEFRQYDTRLGRWISLDKQQNKLPAQSPYNAYVNNPLLYIDTDGNLPVIVWAAIFVGIAVGGESDEQTNILPVIMPIVPISLAAGLSVAFVASDIEEIRDLYNQYYYLEDEINGILNSDLSFEESSSLIRELQDQQDEIKIATEDKLIQIGAEKILEAALHAKGSKPAPGSKLKIEIDPAAKIDRSLLDAPSRPGSAPTFKSDQTPVEIHHVGQAHEGPFKELHWKDHRGKGVDLLNHPNKSKPSKVDRKEFDKAKKEYWKKEFPNESKSE